MAGDWTPAYRLYVVEFKSGVVKIGMTARLPHKRFNDLSARGPISSRFYTGCVVGLAVERELRSRIARIGTPAEGREWFHGVRFPVAKQLAIQLAKRNAQEAR